MRPTTKRNLSGTWKPLNSNQRVNILAIIQLNQIWPYIAKENRCTGPHVTKCLSGKLSGGWSWSAKDLNSPQFASCLWTGSIFFVPPAVVWVWNENNSFPFLKRVLWKWGIQTLQQQGWDRKLARNCFNIFWHEICWDYFLKDI